MIVGTHNAVGQKEKIGMILRAAADLDTSLRIKAERQRRGQFRPLGFVEQIILEVDQDSRIGDLRALGADVTGRRLVWSEKYPLIALTIPEEDLIFTRPLPTRRGMVVLPDIPDPHHIVKNPYKVDQHGQSHLKNIEDLERPRMMKQRIEKIASAKSGRFLVFHPVAQIILLMHGPEPAPSQGNAGMRKVGNHRLGAGTFGTLGSVRMPLSSLAGWDDRKMALLIDPYTGEAYFSGGRYQQHAPDVKV